MTRLLERQGKTFSMRKGIAVPKARFEQSVEEALMAVDELGFALAFETKILGSGENLTDEVSADSSPVVMPAACCAKT